MIVDKRGMTKDSYIIARVKDGVPVDDLYEPFKQIKKTIIISKKIPVGSYIGYLVDNGGEVHILFSNKTKAMQDYKSSKKNFKELTIREVYMDKHGEVIDDMIIHSKG